MATANPADKFATYHQDGTGLDYADQRYYASGSGRFVTSDPYGGSAKETRPASWNRFGYVEGDPVNAIDPDGRQTIYYQGVQYCWHGGEGSGAWYPCGPGVVPDVPDPQAPNCEVYPDAPGCPGRAPTVAPPIDKRRKGSYECDSAVIDAMKRAWARSANGTTGVEAGFFLTGSSSQYRIEDAPTTNERDRMTIPLPPNSFAMFHTHPNSSLPTPSDQDRTTANRNNLQMFVISSRGLYLYDPTNEKTTQLTDGLEWTKPCK